MILRSTTRAEHDLVRLHAFLATINPRAAAQVVRRRRETVFADHFRILYPAFSMSNVHHDTARKHTIRIPELR